MKEYEYIQVDHHNKIAKVMQEYVINSCHLHTYQATMRGTR
ncbi:hypothetical protein ACFLVM_00410 [Chloroflexota bacterium]